jgi:hypothetical protein
MSGPASGIGFPSGNTDERELLLSWLNFLRGAVVRKVTGVTEEQAHWRPGALISLLGIINHLTNMEQRWFEGRMVGRKIQKSESEFLPGPEVTVAAAVEAYKARAFATDTMVRSMPLSTPCPIGNHRDLRWVMLHVINETARHAGHADATRELIDGTTGE